MNTSKTSSSPTPTRSADNQAVRRTKYGLNVTIAIVAAMGLLIVVNAIAFLYLRKSRTLDLTATGQYTLAPQTIQLLRSLEGEYRIVTLFRSQDPVLKPEQVTRAKDLIDQYSRYHRNLSVTHIDPDWQLGRLERFQSELRQRYAGELQPLEQAIQQSQQTLDQIRQTLPSQKALLMKAAQDPAIGQGELSSFLQTSIKALSRLDGEILQQTEKTKTAIDAPLPGYDPVRQDLEQLLTQLDERIYVALNRQFEMFLKQPATPMGTRDALWRLQDSISQSRASLKPSIESLRNLPSVRAYEEIRQAMQGQYNSMILLGPKSAKSLWLAGMFRRPAKEEAALAGESTELLFQGEEKITGALLGMSMDQTPLVVFVSSNSRPAIGPNGEYEAVAQRLKNMNYQVRSWHPAGQRGPMGQPMPADAAPEPEPGQKAVWVLLPNEQNNPMDLAAATAEPKAIELLQKRIDLGEGVMVISGLSATAKFGQNSPIVPMLETYGIGLKNDRIVLKEVTLPDGKKVPTPLFPLTQWPKGIAITAALAGTNGVIVQGSPIELHDKPERRLKTYPLIQITGKDLWAETDFDSFPKVARKTAEASDVYTIAAAVQADQQRLIVLADPAFASNYVTTNADPRLSDRGVALAEIVGAAYPANSEFFINSIQWLAGLDQLIAASARTQDIRRIAAMTPQTVTGLQWTLIVGMPLAVTIIGIGVWWTRRPPSSPSPSPSSSRNLK